LTEKTVREISADQNEPEWMLQHRLKSLEIFHKKPLPLWGPDLSGLNFDEIVYYAKASKKTPGYAQSREDVNPEIRKKFERL
jgi:Fe-S cluster assembly protein SufB